MRQFTELLICALAAVLSVNVPQAMPRQQGVNDADTTESAIPLVGLPSIQQTDPQKPAMLEPTREANSLSPLTLPAGTASGEQINWQVLASGGGRSTSTSYVLSGTVGQTATGPTASNSYKLNQGFWQNFEPASCCVGTTGNVNMSGIVDGGDLALLVAYLTNAPGMKPTLPCLPEANVNASGIIDGGDLALLVAYLTNVPAQKPTLPNCP